MCAPLPRAREDTESVGEEPTGRTEPESFLRVDVFRLGSEVQPLRHAGSSAGYRKSGALRGASRASCAPAREVQLRECTGHCQSKHGVACSRAVRVKYAHRAARARAAFVKAARGRAEIVERAPRTQVVVGATCTFFFARSAQRRSQAMPACLRPLVLSAARAVGVETAGTLN